MIGEFCVLGLDVYVGKGVTYAQLKDALSSELGILDAAIIDYRSDEIFEAPKFSQWAFTHKMRENSIFSFKAEIEMNTAVDWIPILKNMSRNLGALVACPDENSPGDDMLCFLPDGSVEARYFDFEEYEVE